jgi:hypothetical protein
LMQYSHALCERFPSVLVLYYKWHVKSNWLVFPDVNWYL